ncbi:MAG: flagellar biosynthesis anti-sigma factor FlgM [bacterium]|nr:flagellar biosynthesis anti-sigma factor FlgM [bacterium]
MKISDIGDRGGPQRTRQTDRSNQSSEGKRSEKTARPDGDRAEVSESARSRRALFNTAMNLPEVREDVVSKLRDAIRDGKYEVATDRLARAILEFENGLPR